MFSSRVSREIIFCGHLNVGVWKWTLVAENSLSSNLSSDLHLQQVLGKNWQNNSPCFLKRNLALLLVSRLIHLQSMSLLTPRSTLFPTNHCHTMLRIHRTLELHRWSNWIPCRRLAQKTGPDLDTPIWPRSPWHDIAQ